MMHWACLTKVVKLTVLGAQSPRYFLCFTQTLTIPVGYYIPLDRDISYTYHETMYIHIALLYTFHTATSNELQVLPGWKHDTDIPSVMDLFNELQPVIPKWLDFGICLGIPFHKLGTINVNNRLDKARAFKEMLHVWLITSPQPTWEATGKALKNVGEYQLAESIMAKHHCYSNFIVSF